LQLMVEELVVNLILPRQKEDAVNIDLTVFYLEADRLFEMTLEYGGEAFNPFEDSEDLAVIILTKKTRSLEYRFSENLNRIKLTI